MGVLQSTKFIAEDIPKLFPELGNNDKALQWCTFNEAAGPAFTAEIGGNPVGFGGLRTCGIAEAWLYVTPDLQSKRLGERITALRGILEHLEILQERHVIWKVWAEAVKDDGFSHTKLLEREDLLRFAGFKKNDNAFTKVIQEA